MKKVMSPDNNVEDIVGFIEKRLGEKKKEVSSFLDCHSGNQMFVRYLHTPASRRSKTETSFEREQSAKKEQLRRLSTENNFFKRMNQNVVHQPRVKRISVNRSREE